MPALDAKAVIEVDSVAVLSQIVKSEIGVAAIPRFLVRNDLQDGSLIALSPDWTLMPPGVYIVWPNNVSKDSLTLRFVRFFLQSECFLRELKNSKE